MRTLSYIFSFLCAQDASRSFTIAGHTLPFCQRCTGVYLGIGISCAFLLLSRYYRRGLPPQSIIYASIAGLSMMPVFGFHLLDPGPLWRLWSGLVFGNGIAFLALPAAFVIAHRGRVFGLHTRGSTAGYWLFLVLLNTMPFWFSIPSISWYYAVLITSCAGIFGVLFCVAAITALSIKKMVVLFVAREIDNGYETSGNGGLP